MANTKQVTTLKIDNINPDTLAQIQAILESAGTEYTQEQSTVHTGNFDELIGLDKDLMTSEKTRESSNEVLSGIDLDSIKQARAKKTAPAALAGIL